MLTQHINTQAKFGIHQDLLKLIINHLNNLDETLKVVGNKFN
jgi:hypothetical protein